MFDIFVNFITVYRDQYDKLVRSKNEIIINYLSTWFFIDFISSIPSANLTKFNLVSQNGNYNVYFKLLKLPKYIRIIKVMLNIMESRMDPIIDIDDLLNLSNADYRRFNNIMREGT